MSFKTCIALAVVFLFASFAHAGVPGIPDPGQTTTPVTSPAPAATLPTDGVGAAVWYNASAEHKFTGSFYYYRQVPNGPTGTYAYIGNDIVGVGKGVLQSVPTAGVVQHIMFIGSKVELFGTMGAGAAMQTNSSGTGTDVGAAFSGGGGINVALGKGWNLMFPVKAIQANGVTTLVGGVGVNWGHHQQ